MHPDELVIDPAAVRVLLHEQFPQTRGLRVTPVRTGGTVNAVFRVGDGLAARFPLQPMDVAAATDWLHREVAAQGELARVSTVRCPVPLGVGRQGHGYPMPFVLQTWLEGRTPDVGEWAGSDALADDLGDLLLALRAVPTGGRRFAGSGRGGSLRAHDDWVATCIRANRPWCDPHRAAAAWARMRDLPREQPDAMCHGDLVPGNVLVDAGRLVGLLDGGGFGPADPALDLVAAWHLLDAEQRTRLRDRLGCNDLEWARGRAWAFEQAAGLVHYYAHSNPPMHALGVRTLREVLGD